MSSYFETLDEARRLLTLPPLSTIDEIKQKYRTLAKEHHPDNGGNAEIMGRISAAYDIVMEYVLHYRFRFDKEEVLKQSPFDEHHNRFIF